MKKIFTVGKVLGKGQFGTCRLVIDKFTDIKYACKSISKRRLCSMDDVLDVRREVQIMHHLAGHPNIVTIKDVYEDRSHVHLLEELCSGGELFDSIVERGHYSERDAASAFRCIAAVVTHCHMMGVMHRDIKPENFLLSDTSPTAVVKGTDFGLSCFFSEGQTFRDVVGSAFYVAPEVLRKRYDKRADIWSLGVLLYILLSGIPPFYAETEREIFHAVLHAEVSFREEPWPSISEGAKDVIRSMLERDVDLRASAAEVLQHEWVRENGIAGAAPLNNEVLVRLQNFAALNKLQQEALKVIATHLPEAEITGLKAMFLEMDEDGSGSITVDELREALRRKGTRIPADELARIMAQADISGDGTLDYEEFLAATMNLAKLEHGEHLFMAFKFFDADDSGFITREELYQALNKTCSDEEIDLLLKQADSSGDGLIDYTEFCDLMRCGNTALAKATRAAKQGLMRAARSKADLSVHKGDISVHKGGDISVRKGGDISVRKGGDISVRNGGDISVCKGDDSVRKVGDISVLKEGDISVRKGDASVHKLRVESISPQDCGYAAHLPPICASAPSSAGRAAAPQPPAVPLPLHAPKRLLQSAVGAPVPPPPPEHFQGVLALLKQPQPGSANGLHAVSFKSNHGS